MELTCQPNKKKKNHPNEMSTTLGRRNILLQMQKNLWRRSLATRKKGASKQAQAGIRLMLLLLYSAVRS